MLRHQTETCALGALWENGFLVLMLRATRCLVTDPDMLPTESNMKMFSRHVEVGGDTVYHLQ